MYHNDFKIVFNPKVLFYQFFQIAQETSPTSHPISTAAQLKLTDLAWSVLSLDDHRITTNL